MNESPAAFQPRKSKLGKHKMAGLSHDGCQGLVAQFQALNSNAHQREALNALVKALTHHQIRELRLLVGEVNLDCDIIAELPLELSQEILQYLPLYQVFQARRVSSRWNQILSSAQTVEFLLRDWYPTHDDERGLRIPDGLSAGSIASLKAEHIDAYRTGHAFSFAKYELDSVARHVAYADGIIAWVDREDSFSVKSLDLKTGQKCSFLSEPRTRPDAIAMSSSIIAALNSCRCYMWAFRTGEHYSLRLPSALNRDLAVSGECLAVLQNPTSSHAITRVKVITWTLKNQKTSSFSVTLSGEHGLECTLKMLLDQKGDSLLFFELVYRHCHYTRTSFDGNVLSRGVIEIPDVTSYLDCYQNAPKETNGQAIIWSFAKQQYKEEDFPGLMLLSYNFRENRLEICTQKVIGQRMDINPDNIPSYFFGKSTTYFLEQKDSRPRLSVINLQDSTCRQAKMGFPAGLSNRGLRSEQGWSYPPIYPFGDEAILIMDYGSGFYVWSFDANVRLFNEDVAYREERKKNAERRRNLKQNPKDMSSGDAE